MSDDLCVSSKLYKLWFSLHPRMGPFNLNTLHLNTLYLHRERVRSTEAAMFCTVAQTGQTKHLLSFYDN